MTCRLILLLLGLAACTPAAPLPVSSAAPGPAPFKAVLVAGDGELPAFDNAIVALDRRLRAAGLGGADIQRLTASPPLIEREGLRPATLANVLDAVAAMRPGAGQGCLVFATSHGEYQRGLALTLTDEALSPAALDGALQQGCGGAPTAVVISGCFSGDFAQPPMARPNRVVLTAARPDRTSFGCDASRTFTFYDECLLGALDAAATWPQLHAETRRCVAAAETRSRVRPSEPQAWFGNQVRDLAVLRQ